MKSTLLSLHHFNGSLRFLTVLWPLHQRTSIWKLSLEWTCSLTLDLYQFIALDDLLELEVDQPSIITARSWSMQLLLYGSICCQLPVSISNKVFKICLLSCIIHFHKRFGILSYSYYLLPCHKVLCRMLTVWGVCVWASLGGLSWWRAWSHN